MSLLNRNKAITRLAAPRGPKGEPGTAGRSAYQVAVSNGYNGTEEQWLASLKGANGAPGPASTIAGPAGPQGPAGPTGAASSVPGPQGPAGATGPQGPKGDNGSPGTQGAQGLPGNDGAPGTPGAKGDTGERGPQGEQGPTGATGAQGLQGIQGPVGGDLWTIIKLAENFVTSNSTNTNVTNFNFTPAINKTYLIFGYFLLRTATATVGPRPGVAWPSNLTDSIMRVEASNSLTTAAIRTWGARSTQNAASTGVATTTESHWGSLDGVMITSGTTSGNFQITLASETAGTNVTMVAGSILMYREL